MDRRERKINKHGQCDFHVRNGPAPYPLEELQTPPLPKVKCSQPETGCFGLSTENLETKGFLGLERPLFGFGLADPAPKGYPENPYPQIWGVKISLPKFRE